MMYKVPVELGARGYDIHIVPQSLDEAGAYLQSRFGQKRCFSVMDENVAKTQWPRLQKALEKVGYSSEHLILPAGEGTKSYQQLESVVEALLAAKIERNDFVIAFGGGVIGDLVGFAAAILRRGVQFVQIPTSLLAQVDSSVGGKTGINSPQGKNLVGAFHQPALVLIDPTVLETLTKRHLRAGYAEIIKYALINDRAFYDWLEGHGLAVFDDMALLCEAIQISCQSKADIVAIDEKESGARALLNLGHSFGHALEKLTGYSDKLVHGEAVSIGMCMAMEFSYQQDLFNGQDLERIKNHLRHMGLPISVNEIDGFSATADEMLAAMYQDKKVEAGQLTLILSHAIGEAFIAKNVNGDDVKRYLERCVFCV